jgi:DNA helicase II / ATP-dependent DNA helicase PcrA
VRSGTGNAVVRATAGAGKTTTLVQVAEALPPDLRACFLAYGKDASLELENRLPKHVPAKTTHSLGWSVLKTALGPEA